MGKDFFGSLRERIKCTIGNIFELAAVLFLASFFAAILIQVFVRYVMHHPFQWTEEFARLFYVGMVFIAAAAAVDDHLRFDLGINFLKKRSSLGYRILTLLIDVTVLIVLLYLVAGSYNRVVDGWTKLLPGTGWRVAYLYMPPLVGSAMLIVYTVLGIGSKVISLARKVEVNGR